MLWLLMRIKTLFSQKFNATVMTKRHWLLKVAAGKFILEKFLPPCASNNPSALQNTSLKKSFNQISYGLFPAMKKRLSNFVFQSKCQTCVCRTWQLSSVPKLSLSFRIRKSVLHRNSGDIISRMKNLCQ